VKKAKSAEKVKAPKTKAERKPKAAKPKKAPTRGPGRFSMYH
jgi:hypothetical protein